MLKKFYFFTLALLISISSFSQSGTGALKGTITDEKTGETIPFAAVVVKTGETQVAGTATDINGVYTIKPLTPGTYNVLVSVVGYNSIIIAGVLINSDKITFKDIGLKSGIQLDEIEIVEYTVPLINRDGGASGGTVTGKEIEKMPLRNPASIASTVAGVSNTSQGVSIRGSRPGSSDYYIDGVKVVGSINVPKSALQEVSVITGGIPANYGDATGGIVNIVTKGAASNLHGSLELVTSGFKTGENANGLDRFGYNLVEFSLTGPLIFEKDSVGNKNRSILGFFVSGNYTNLADPRPTFGIKKINDDARQQLLDNPLRLSEGGNSVLYNSEFLTDDAFHEVKTAQNRTNQQVNAAAKIDIAPSLNIDLSVGGQYNLVEGPSYNTFNSLMNSDNFAKTNDQSGRAYIRFVQRFNNNSSGRGVKNAFYQVLVDYTKSFGVFEGVDHKDNFFRYGYIGKYDIFSEPAYVFNTDRQAWLLSGFEDTLVTFTPSQINGEIAKYTSQYFDIFQDNEGGQISRFSEIQAAGGLLNGVSPQSSFGLFGNIGSQPNFYRKYDNQQFRISADGSADIGNHALQLGVQFEQRIQSRYAVGDNGGNGPINLWTLARQLQNSHLSELDKSDSTVTFPDGTFAFITYPVLVNLASQSTFDRNLRESLGLDPDGNEIINVDALNPDQLDLALFSPDELLNSGQNYVSYFGYDYTGKKINSSTSINDYFTEVDDNGNFSRTVGSFNPSYISGYIIDKFALKDIIFNVGVRVDRYDANQSVLIDPYVFGATFKAGEVGEIGGQEVSHPNGIGSDYVVYVDDVNDPTRIVGYRDDEKWFDANGAPVQDPALLEVGGSINPYLVNGGGNENDIKNLTSAFQDYKPQVNVMPRIAFSFPISDVALFFAHYDILTQRPSGNNILNPVDYLFIRDVAGSRNLSEPNLRSEKTTDYELGFQQVVSKSSSIKLSIFYRQMQDQIQVRSYLDAYPVTYKTFDNIDFGTVKGGTVSYDLRRTGNIRLNVSYTLQFADGTGSSSTTAQALVNAGQPNLRTVFPLDFDFRNRFVLTFDYRYGRGAGYNGPMAGASQILADFGVNLVGRFNSGTPYSASKSAVSLTGAGSSQLTGQINGSRQASLFNIDIQVDKSFPIRLGTDKNGNQKMGNINIYFWFINLLSTRQTLSVYRFTGVGDDDGYLASTLGQQEINSQTTSPEAFVSYYNIGVRNPFNYGSPRRIRFGIRFDF